MSVVYPRPWVKISGVQIPAIEIQVTRKAERSADRFHARLSLTKAGRYGLALNDFADWKPQDVEVMASIAPGGGDAQTVILGRVDEPEICWKDMTVTLDGRDKSSLLTEKRRSEKFANQKTKDIIEKIAKDHKLMAHVQSDAGYAGKIHTQDHAHLALNRTDYDILSDLAEREGCRWYVDGNDLYFEPKDTDNGTVEVYWYPPGAVEAYTVSNALDLKTRRNMTAARPHRMRHRSWHSYDAAQHEATAEMGGVGEPLEFEHHHNGKKLDQIEALAKGRLKNATRHDLTIHVEMSLDLTVTPRKRLNLRGTGTIYDQGYDIDGVEIDMGWERPALMELDAKSAKDGRATGQGSSSEGAGTGKANMPETPARTPAQASYPPGGA